MKKNRELIVPNSHTFILVHYVFTPLNRQPMFANADRNRILDYISGIVANYQSVLYCGYIMRDHIHLLVLIHPKHSVAEIAQVIKANSSKFINQQKLVPGRFSWGQGYGAFSCSYSQIETVKKYILTQEEHHKLRDYDEEFRELLKKHNIEAVC